MKLVKPYRDDCRHLRLDTNETVFFARQLEYVKAQTYDVLYAELSAFRLFPISTEAGPGAKTITYRSYEKIGQAKVIAGHGNDLPRVDVIGREASSNVRSIGASYGWSLQDIRSAMMAGVNLNAQQAMAAVQAHNQVINSMAWFGDTAHGIVGLQTTGVVTNSQAALVGQWDQDDADVIINDVNELLTSIIQGSSGVESANVVAMPPDRLAKANTVRIGNTNVSALAYLKTVWPGVEFTQAVELTSWSGGHDALLGYRRDPMKLSLEIPQGYEELPVQMKGLEFEVPTHTRCGGLIVYYPGAIAIRTGIEGGS